MNVSPFVKDLVERSAKTFAQAFLAFAGVVGLLTHFDPIVFIHALYAGAAGMVLSWVTSLASLNFGNSGTASLSSAVQVSELPPK
jgi:hypothetical protein